MTYQYRAFGVPALGLKRGLEEKTVIAPYATLLAITIAPRESLRNLKRLARLGLLDDYGYYERWTSASSQPRRGAWSDCASLYGPSSRYGISGADQSPPWKLRAGLFPLRRARANGRAIAS